MNRNRQRVAELMETVAALRERKAEKVHQLDEVKVRLQQCR
jgi:hypothetical protein